MFYLLREVRNMAKRASKTISFRTSSWSSEGHNSHWSLGFANRKRHVPRGGGGVHAERTGAAEPSA